MDAYFQWLREKRGGQPQATAQQMLANSTARVRADPFHPAALSRPRNLGYFALYSLPSLPGYGPGLNSRLALAPCAVGPFYCFLSMT
jgi:hypothetical protein